MVIPIGDSRRNDSLVWAATRNGRYSVQSGYRWCQSQPLESRDLRLPVVCSVPKDVWKSVWCLMVPPKIRHFLRLSLHNGLPTRVALYNKRSSPSPLYPICLCHDETVEHLFFGCPWVAAVWFGGALSYKVDCARISYWVHWLQAVFSSNLGASTDRNWFQACIVFTCWFIWKARCKFVFNQVSVNPVQVIFAISSALDSFLHAVRNLRVCQPEVGAIEDRVVRWSHRPPSFSKINVDASWSKES